MKSNLSILLFCFFSFLLRKLNWMTIIRRLLLKSKSKKISRFYADWNTASENGQRNLVHPEILKYLNDKFYIVKFNLKEMKL